MRSAPQFPKPEGVELDQWRGFVSQELGRHCQLPVLLESLDSSTINVQQEWDLFQIILQDSLRGAYELVYSDSLVSDEVAAECRRRCAKRGVKGLPAAPVHDSLSIRVRHQVGNMHIRKGRRWLAQLYESRRILRVPVHGRSAKQVNDFVGLKKKLVRRLGGVPSLDVLQREINWWSAEIVRLEGIDTRRRLSQWKHDMITNDKALGRWLRSKSTVSDVAVRSLDGSVAQTQGEVASAIHSYWTNFWVQAEAETPSVTQRTDALCAGLSSASVLSWGYPSGSELFTQAGKSKGAAGPDGWSGVELSTLPIDCFDLFSRLSARWILAGSAPFQMSESRMVMLPKEGKILADASISVGNLRPITVMSSGWRLWFSAFLRMDSVVAWIKQIIPVEFAFGNNIPTEQMVCELLEKFQEMKYLLSLDYSKAYDRLHPQVSINMLRHVGWPRGLASVLEEVWNRQRRWIHWGAVVCPSPLNSPALPQGDPAGPLIMSLWVLAGLTVVRQSSVATFARIYIDDRTLVADNAASLVDSLRAWDEWGRSVGLRENLDKVVAVAQGRHQNEVLSQLLPESVASSACLLGVTVSRSAVRGDSDKETSRILRLV